MTTAHVAVIIPFFQRQPGLLRRAVASVIAQLGVDPVQLIVVDDGSPVAAEEEIDAALRAQLPQLTILRQTNGGVGRARNAGLDIIGDGASLVAFLDSDDTWVADHLARAAQVIAAGADVFFGVTAGETSHERNDDQKWPSGALLAAPVAGLDGVHLLTRDAASYTLRYGLPIQSVVFRRSIAPQLRFATDVRRAGEDLRFTFELVRRAGAVAFSARPEVTLGRGVNIYRSTIEPGSPHAIARMIDEVRTREVLARTLAADPVHCAVNDSLMRQSIEDLAREFLHGARRGRLRSCLAALLYLAPRPSAFGRFMRAIVECIGAKWAKPAVAK